MQDKKTGLELKQVLGAMIFGSSRPLRIKEMRECLIGAPETDSSVGRAFAGVSESDIQRALDDLRADIEKTAAGFELAAVAGGYSFRSDASCGAWLRYLLNADKPSRLSKPGLETLAIIAYRQPVSRSEIETVRGVNVDHMLRVLMEMQLVRIVGRSKLPGRPFLYGTTQLFLDHFGLKSLGELNEMAPMLLAEREKKRAGSLQSKQSG